MGLLKLSLSTNRINQVTAFPNITNVVIKLTIDPKVRPIQQPLKRIPISVEARMEERLKKAPEKDIIEKVTEPSAWISLIVVIFKPNGDIRICVDMHRINKAILREKYPLPTFDTFMTKLRNAKYFSRLALENAYHQI